MKKRLLGFLAIAFSGVAFAEAEESPVPTESLPSGRAGAVEARTHAETEDSSARTLDNHGLGFGLVSSPATAGLQLYYDYNLNPRPNGFDQVHVFLYSGTTEEKTVLGSSKIALSQRRLVASYRRVWNSGWFAGLGLGIATGDLSYKYDVTWLDPSVAVVKKTFTYSAGVLSGDLGWQGKDGYYFTVGIQPSTYLGFKGDYDETEIPDTFNHRMKANNLWTSAEEDKSLLYIGFGWYID